MKTKFSLWLMSVMLLSFVNPGISFADQACDRQPRFIYSGGLKDNFKLPPDPAHPSVCLETFMIGSPQGVVDYDVPMNNGRFGESFLLEPRTICKMRVEFKVRATGDIPPTDTLQFGSCTGASLFTPAFTLCTGLADPKTDPPNPDCEERAALPGNFGQTRLFNRLLTTDQLNRLNAVLADPSSGGELNIFLQDDMMINFIRLHVWYSPLN